MAVSAFRSTSKRGNLGSSSKTMSSKKENSIGDLSKKASHRRSMSVSALSRTNFDISSSSSSSNIIEFSNKRDNPLFCNSSPSSPDELESKSIVSIAKFAENTAKLDEPVKKSASSAGLDSRRGRSVARRSDYQSSGPRREYGRSLSRVDMGGRHRSVSRGHYGNSESEVDNDINSNTLSRNKNNGNIVINEQTNASELSKQKKSLQTWSSRHRLPEPSDGSTSSVTDLNWEDVCSTSSYSETEEKTIKAVFEQMKTDSAGDIGGSGIYETVRSEVRRAVSEIRNDIENVFQQKSPAVITAANIADIPPEMMNPDAIKLVSDIRREYATKLEQSQDHARRLREDLAVEEQRGQELSRILREILPDPTTPEVQNPRPRRKTSIERRKMSRRLTEDAMNYFDECVSISTFDSSDFSAPEDPSSGSVVSTRYFDDHLNRKASIEQVQCFVHHEDTGTNMTSIDGSSNSNQMNGNLKNLSSFGSGSENLASSSNLMGVNGFDDIKSFVRKFEKDFLKNGSDVAGSKSSYNADDYKVGVLAENLLFDRVIYKNRINSGGLLLCHVRIF